LHFLKSQRVALKLVCYSLYRKERKSLGYIMLDLRSASGFPPKERWYPLLNSKSNGSNRPEIKIAFGIGNIDTLNNSNLNYSPPIKLINKSPENVSNMDLSNDDSMQKIADKYNNNNDSSSNNSNDNSLEPVLTDDGFYKIGKGEDQFILIISLIATYNLSKLVTDIPNQIDDQQNLSKYYFCYSILGSEIKTEEFDNINKPSFSIERVSIRFRSTKQDIIEFFSQRSNIRILLNKGEQMIAYSDIDLHQLWKDDKSDFNPIFRKSIPLFRVGTKDRTIISNEIQPQVMILMCLQPQNDDIDEIMQEVDRIIENNDVVEANSFLLSNNNNNNNEDNINGNYNSPDLKENYLIEDQYQNDQEYSNDPINENDNNNDNEQIYINENNSDNNKNVDDIIEDNNIMTTNVIASNETVDNIEIIEDHNNFDNNDNIINMEYNESLNPAIKEINENGIDELSFNIESLKDYSIKNVEYEFNHQHHNLTIEEEIIELNNKNNIIENNEDVIINNNDENINITNSNLKIEYSVQDEYNSNSFIPLDSSNLNLDNTENIQTDFIMGEGNTELLIKNVATSIENQNTEKEILPEEIIEKIPPVVKQNSNEKSISKLPISVTSNLKKSNEIISSTNAINTVNNVTITMDNNNQYQKVNSTPTLNKLNNNKPVFQSMPNIKKGTVKSGNSNTNINANNNINTNFINTGSNTNVKRNSNDTIYKNMANVNKGVVSLNNSNTNINKTSNINLNKVNNLAKSKSINSITKNNNKSSSTNSIRNVPKQTSKTQTEVTPNIFQEINWHQYKFTINLQSIRNIKLNANNIYCKYLYLPFGNKLPHLTDPPINIIDNNEISIPCSSYSYEFFMDPLVLSNSLESIPLEIELWQKNDQLNREIKIGQTTLFMNEILGMPEISKSINNKQSFSIRQWSNYVPIFSIENIGVPLEKIAELRILLQMEDYGLVEDKPSPPSRQNSDPLNQATPTPFNHRKNYIIIKDEIEKKKLIIIFI